MTSYEPTPTDIRWAAHMLLHIKNGGIWAFPDDFSIYRFDLDNKEIILVYRDPNHSKPEMYHRTQVVFGVLGYTVREGLEEADNGNV